jgi:hypothetical protein
LGDRVICCNCFRFGHAHDVCNFPLATIIEESPQKSVQVVQSGGVSDRLEGVEACSRTVEERLREYLDTGIVEIDDERLNQAYDSMMSY